jgi:hypothetical protein
MSLHTPRKAKLHLSLSLSPFLSLSRFLSLSLTFSFHDVFFFAVSFSHKMSSMLWRSTALLAEGGQVGGERERERENVFVSLSVIFSLAELNGKEEIERN